MYENERLDEATFRSYCNVLSNTNWALYVWFNNKLKTAFKGKFYSRLINFSYKEHKQKYKIRNQLLLLHKELFLAEVDEIFKLLKKKSITSADIYNSESNRLIHFTDSIVKTWLAHATTRNRKRTKEDLLKMIETEEQWNEYGIKKIKEGFSQTQTKVEVNNELLEFAREWCANEIKQLEFTNAINQTKPNQYSHSERVLYIIKLYTLFKPEIEDAYLLKMLEADISIYNNTDKLSTSSFIAATVKSKAPKANHTGEFKKRTCGSGVNESLWNMS